MSNRIIHRSIFIFLLVSPVDIDLSLTDENKAIITTNDNELFIHEDGDLIEKDFPPKSTTTDVTSEVKIDEPTINVVSTDEIETNQINLKEHDEEFERNFLRAVDRALGVVHKDQTLIEHSADNGLKQTDETPLDLVEMTERALASFQQSTLFTVKKNKNVTKIFIDERMFFFFLILG